MTVPPFEPTVAEAFNVKPDRSDRERERSPARSQASMQDHFVTDGFIGEERMIHT